jgi:uncharacterized protein (TIGR02145 family)
MTVNSIKQNFINLPLVILFVLSALPSTQGQTQTVKQKGEVIRQVKIGTQIWMDKNLNVKSFRNGDAIPEARSAEEWRKAAREETPAWCYYQNDSITGEKYGIMYNWYAVNDSRGLAPAGWRVATNEDWIILEEYFGLANAGTKMKCDSINTLSESSAKICVPLGGYRTRDGNFTGLAEFAYLSSATQERLPESKDKFFIWGRGIHIDNATVMRCGLDKEFGLYVRCVR